MSGGLRLRRRPLEGVRHPVIDVDELLDQQLPRKGWDGPEGASVKIGHVPAGNAR